MSTDDAIASAPSDVRVAESNTSEIFIISRVGSNDGRIDFSMSGALKHGQRVELSGLVARADLNGLAAEVQEFRTDTGRYSIVVLETGEGVRVKPENVRAVDEPEWCAPPDWRDGLEEGAAHEWLVDCYRLRVEDDQTFACYLHGLYHPGADALSRLQDFWLFARLASARGVVPSEGWDWRAFCAAAAPLLKAEFTLEDAATKYGAEQLEKSGGRSLRATSERIYGTSPLADEPDPYFEHLREQIQAATTVDAGDNGTESIVVDIALDEVDPVLFADVGGVEPWRELLATLR